MVAEEEDWTRTTREFVGHSLGKMPYLSDQWLVDSASTCMVANETFKEFDKVGPAQVTITVGGDNRIRCTTVGNLRIATENGSVEFQDVRIVPGFGVNILSGPYLEKKLGLTLSSDGRNWWARRRGQLVLKGVADNAGLYWVKVTRLQGRPLWTPRDASKDPQSSPKPTAPLKDGRSLAKQQESGLRTSGDVLMDPQSSSKASTPFKDGRSPTFGKCLSLFPQPSRNGEDSESSKNEGDAENVGNC